MKLVKYFAHNILVLVGLVLIWRGMWYILDEVDILFFGESHIITTVGGVILGFLILYLPDKDLKEISKL
jgi:hypothetical protein